MRFRKALEQYLALKGLSPITAARTAGLNRDAIRSVFRGRSPSVDRAAEICESLGLEFYIGPPRTEIPSIDLDRLSLAIETAEEALAVAHKEMDPQKKAELVLAVYEFFAETPPVDKQRVIELVRSVA